METGKIKLTVGEVTPKTFADILNGKYDDEIEKRGFGFMLLSLSDCENETDEEPEEDFEDVDDLDDEIQDAYDDGFDDGYDAGYADGYLKAKKEAKRNG